VAKDVKPTVWFSANGERLGTYNGHGGAVWCVDVNRILDTGVLGAWVDFFPFTLSSKAKCMLPTYEASRETVSVAGWGGGGGWRHPIFCK
jgi:hypothetical protein